MSGQTVDLVGALQAFFRKEFEKGDPAATAAAGFSLAFEQFPITLSPEDCLLDAQDPDSFVPARLREMITRRVLDHATIASGAYRMQGSEWVSDAYSAELLEPARYRTDPAGDAVAEQESLTRFAVVRDQARKEFRTVASVMGQPDEFAPTDTLPEDWLDLRQQDNWLTYTFNASNAGTPATPSPTAPSIQWRAIDPALLTATVGVLETDTPPPPPRRRFIRGAADVTAFRGAAARIAAPAFEGARAGTFSRVEAFGRKTPLQDRKALADLFKNPRKVDTRFDKAHVRARTEIAGILAEGEVQTPATPPNDAMTVSFQYQVVRASRPWMYFPFLRHPNWYVPGLKAGALSDPGNPDAPGRMGRIPSALLVIKDLSITANWSEQDAAALDASFALGPFGTGKKATIVGQVLKCDGVQAIGCISEGLPLLPPRSDPTLGVVP